MMRAISFIIFLLQNKTAAMATDAQPAAILPTSISVSLYPNTDNNTPMTMKTGTNA